MKLNQILKNNCVPFCCFGLIVFGFTAKAEVSIDVTAYGKLTNGKAVSLYTLKAGDIAVKVINYGGIITELWVPDKQGNLGDVVLGFDNLPDYEKKNRYFGAIVGRFANRIHEGKASIFGETHQLTLNRPPNQLHGGVKGFDKVLWDATTDKDEHSATLTLRYLSIDGEEGYPGNLAVTVRYTVNSQNELVIDYQGNTDKSTVVNLTQHSYFNLAVSKNIDVLNHELTINADSILPLETSGFPTGDVMSVIDSPFDFRQPKQISADINEANEQLRIAKGYDHFWLATSMVELKGELMAESIEEKKKADDLTLKVIAELTEKKSGRRMTVSTSEAGLQVYTANYLNKTIIGKYQQAYSPQYGICLETGQLPNSPAEEKFPTYVLTPHSTYNARTVYKFSNQ